jgi:nucleotide-binding universal stress UspA family protein
MTSLTRILCAIDLEKASERAFERALSLAVISKAKLYLLHAIPAHVRFSSRSGERVDYLSELRTRAEAAGVRTRVDEQHGDPARVIALHANARNMDLVVLGSNRRRGWRRLREGSVSERVLRGAAWPVLIVPWDTPRTGSTDKKRRS